jgi:hypothetical protein
MKRLKEELTASGASIESPEIDANQLTGMRRLHVLHSRALKPSKSEAQPVADSSRKASTGDLPHTKVASIKEVTVTGKATSSSPKVLAEGEEGLFGLSRTVTILVFLGGGALLIILSYVIYKYFSWRPKMVARKGYKAVAKSKGLDLTDSDAAGETSSGIPSNRNSVPGLIVASKG